MSNLICPFCQQELEDANIHSSGLYFECPNCYDKQKEKDDNYTATPKVWQELIRTRRALNVAVDALNRIKGKHDPRCAVYHIDEKTAYDALEQITALEQKDVK